MQQLETLSEVEDIFNVVGSCCVVSCNASLQRCHNQQEHAKITSVKIKVWASFMNCRSVVLLSVRAFPRCLEEKSTVGYNFLIFL
nr:uncharacterized protein LOC128696336 isoform X2 [Cherax quadricarinatus]